MAGPRPILIFLWGDPGYQPPLAVPGPDPGRNGRATDRATMRSFVYEDSPHMPEREHRRHARLPLSARVKVTHSAFGATVVRTRDVWNSGLFIEYGEQPYPPLGSLLQVQALDMPVEAEILDARIVRVCVDGVGLEFCGGEP